MKEKNRKKEEACQAENPKGRSRQKLGPKKKRKRKESPVRLKTQKGGLGKSWGQRKEEEEEEKKIKIGRSYQVGNLKMQPKKRIILQDESLEVWFKRNEHKNNC